MNDTNDPFDGIEKFAIGQSVTRKEDPRLLTGGGRFTDDVNLAGQAFAHVVRSPYAHGELRALDVAEALAVPGVLAVVTGQDLEEAGFGHLPCNMRPEGRDGRPLVVPPRRALTVDRVRHLGEAIAVVVAETRAAARDGAEAVVFEIAPLAAITTAPAAVADGAPEVWPDMAPGNVALDWEGGDFAAVEAAFEQAAHVTRLHMDNNRVAIATVEPRAAVAEYDAETERFTLHLCSQGVFGLRNQLAGQILNVPQDKVRVRTYDVGGSFGMKSAIYPEYPPILYAARKLGRPVKWCDDRSDSFLSDHGGRDSVVEAALALDADGNFLAVKVEGIANLGAYLSPVGPNMQTNNILKNVISVYATPAVAVRTRCVFTNTTPVAAYRGAGRPEANYYMERLIDQAAQEMGLDRLKLRQKNLIAPIEAPYQAPNGQIYDSGDFPAVLGDALAHADLPGFEARRAASEGQGRLRGLGFTTYLEVTAPPTKEMGGFRFRDDGTVAFTTGTLNYGQGHASTFAQMVAEKLGIPFDRVELLQGDSDTLLHGGGTGGSRSVMASGGAIIQAGDKVIEKGRDVAAHVLEAAAEDIEFEKGKFRVVGTDRTVDILALAQQARELGTLADGSDASLDVELVADLGPSAYPNGCHVCEVEIDQETGSVRIDRYLMVDDFGTLINPMLVEGQVHGGIAQGFGQALMERTLYDEEGQILTGTFMDYAMPRAADMPAMADMVFLSHPVPAKTTAFGAKGCGEAGVSGSLGAVIGAINDALGRAGRGSVEMPATSEKVWRALNGSS
jgi:carbon-monoxide dehydrogenase large subunit